LAVFRRKKDLREGMLSARSSEPAPAPTPVHEAASVSAPTAPPARVAKAERSGFWSEGVRLKAFPIIVTFCVGYGLPLIAKTITYIISGAIPLPGDPQYEWASYYYGHAVQLALTLFAISFARRFVRADFGPHMPYGKSYVGWAIIWSVLLGALSTAVDWLPQIIAHQAPDGPYSLDPVNMAGWLSFEGLFSGPTEEPLYRGLLVTYMMTAIPGRYGLGRYAMSAGGVVVAAIMALEYLFNFIIHPWYIAAAQVLCVFALGVLFAYWFEKSKSLLAPVIGQNVSAFTKYALIFAMVSAWR
jgi:hypothetical protein